MHHERLGESVFSFTTEHYKETRASDVLIKTPVLEVNRILDTNSPANPPLFKAKDKKTKRLILPANLLAVRRKAHCAVADITAWWQLPWPKYYCCLDSEKAPPYYGAK